jgi:hypothetical protein
LTWFHSTQEQVAVAAQDGVRLFDNAAAESINATLKKELINLHLWKDIDTVK